MVNRPTGYGVGSAKIQLAPPPVVAQRAPATSDINYDPGQIWVDQAGDNIYVLASESAGSATWVLAVSVPGEIATLTGDSGGAISPVASNIDLSGTSGEVTTAGSAGTITFGLDNPLTPPGDVAITGTLSSTGATTLATTGDSVNTFGNATGATSVTITSGTGGLSLVSTGSGDITASSGDTLLLDSVGILEINSSGGVIGIGNDAVAQNINIGTGAAARTITIGNTTGATGIALDSGSGDIALNDSVNNDTNINTGTSTGAVSIGNSAAGAITLDTAAGISLDAATASNYSVSAAGADLTLSSTLGTVIVNAGEDTADAIYLHANAGTSETIRLHSDLGTGADSVHLESDVGGVTLTSGLASTDAINLSATAGGVDIDGALEINITSSEASVADAVTISASHAEGGITLDAGVTQGVTFTNGTQSHQMLVGSGSPNGSVTASQGSLYVDVAGSTSTTILWANADGATSWVAVGA